MDNPTNAFSYIVFGRSEGKAVAHGRTAEVALASVLIRPGATVDDYKTLFCGDTGPLIWAEKFSLEYAGEICEKVKISK